MWFDGLEASSVWTGMRGIFFCAARPGAAAAPEDSAVEMPPAEYTGWVYAAFEAPPPTSRVVMVGGFATALEASRARASALSRRPELARHDDELFWSRDDAAGAGGAAVGAAPVPSTAPSTASLPGGAPLPASVQGMETDPPPAAPSGRAAVRSSRRAGKQPLREAEAGAAVSRRGWRGAQGAQRRSGRRWRCPRGAG